ncbi:MAG: hypothetical protein WCT14_06200 [Treponemataceae bacterium]
MKLAVTIWNKRIAPVFDCAGTVLLLDVAAGSILSETTLDMNRRDLEDRARTLRERGATELICGAISHEAKRRLLAEDIVLHPFVAGDVPTVLLAWSQNELGREEFSMPGCGCAGVFGRHS